MAGLRVEGRGLVRDGRWRSVKIGAERYRQGQRGAERLVETW